MWIASSLAFGDMVFVTGLGSGLKAAFLTLKI